MPRSLFFFQSAPPHPPLHSFPTRRSSDPLPLTAGELAPLLADGSVETLGKPADPIPDPRPAEGELDVRVGCVRSPQPDRKSTRLNSSHITSSYAVFCLKKKKLAYPT